MEYVNTIDIDDGNKEFLERIICKIAMNQCCRKLQYRVSSSMNHYHIRIECSQKCDICRMVFDDPQRYMYDYIRPEKWRGILWNIATIHLGNHTIIMKASEWITVKDVNNHKNNRKLYKPPLHNIT